MSTKTTSHCLSSAPRWTLQLDKLLWMFAWCQQFTEIFSSSVLVCFFALPHHFWMFLVWICIAVSILQSILQNPGSSESIIISFHSKGCVSSVFFSGVGREESILLKARRSTKDCFWWVKVEHQLGEG